MIRVTDVSDDFNRSDNADVGAIWTPVLNSLQIVGNQLRGTVATDENFEYCNSVSLPDDQWVQATIAALSADDEFTLVARNDGTANNYYYGIARHKTSGTNGARIAKIVGGSFSVLANVTQVWSASDVLRLEVIGTGLELFRNDVSILTATDSGIASGARAGLNLFNQTAVANNVADDWSAGHFVSGAPFALGNRGTAFNGGRTFQGNIR